MGERYRGTLLFVRGNVGGDKMNFLQAKMFLRRSCQSQVATMDGIEGSAKKSYVHPEWTVCCSFLACPRDWQEKTSRYPVA